MSLINCPECGAERVSSFAAACPHCGFPVAEHLKAEEEAKRKQELMEAKEQEKLERQKTGKASVTYLCSGEAHDALRILQDGKLKKVINKGTTEEISCEEPTILLFYMNDEVFDHFTIEPGYEYVVELHIYTDRLPEFTFQVR